MGRHNLAAAWYSRQRANAKAEYHRCKRLRICPRCYEPAGPGVLCRGCNLLSNLRRRKKR